jgi:glycine/D-amino acid oxidase-like deaminating enzyme
LFEKDTIGSHASGFALGSLLPPSAPKEEPIAMLSDLSLQLHAEIAELSVRNGLSTDFRKKSSIVLATTPSKCEELKILSDRHASDLTSKYRWLEPTELSHIEARITDKVMGGLYFDGSYEVDSRSICFSLWQMAEQKGADLNNSNVEELEIINGSVKGVRTNKGSFDFDYVIVAAGPWTKPLLQTVGINVPVNPQKGQILRLKPIGPDIDVSIWWEGNYITSKPDGLIWLGTTEEDIGFNENVTEFGRDTIIQSAADIFPFVKSLDLVKQTACLRPVTPDLQPVIEDLSYLIKGLIVCSGGSRNGILFGPAMGLLASEMILDRKSVV